jgi:hypothetical protein
VIVKLIVAFIYYLGLLNGNLMHLTSRENASMKLSIDQIMKMQKDYDEGILNQGSQVWY